mmetsp:Transcript_101339/g.321877  ORF Transcript_101339/g.321877 Transcript_101339/m.321877 type:complete len:251 (-) Transcript_101339:1122-1874(-)
MDVCGLGHKPAEVGLPARVLPSAGCRRRQAWVQGLSPWSRFVQRGHRLPCRRPGRGQESSPAGVARQPQLAGGVPDRSDARCGFCRTGGRASQPGGSAARALPRPTAGPPRQVQDSHIPGQALEGLVGGRRQPPRPAQGQAARLLRGAGERAAQVRLRGVAEGSRGVALRHAAHAQRREGVAGRMAVLARGPGEAVGAAPGPVAGGAVQRGRPAAVKGGRARDGAWAGVGAAGDPGPRGRRPHEQRPLCR